MHSSVATRAPKQDAMAAARSSRKPFFDVNDFTPAILNQAKSAFHLHGSLANPAGMVVTTRLYIMTSCATPTIPARMTLGRRPDDYLPKLSIPNKDRAVHWRMAERVILGSNVL